MRGRLTEAWQVLYQSQDGMLEAGVSEALLRRLEQDARYGLFRAVWNQTIKTGFPTDFQEYVEARMAATARRESETD